MIQGNNAALLGANMVIDPSGWAGQFRDGQKLRQEYEGRQQQKALNEIMKVGDHNGRLELAQQHKYAGALVPQLQKYEEDRQKAALDNLKTSADIGKVYGETGKLGAETGEIGVKTMGQTIKNMTDKYSQISAGALTQNPQYFALMLGDFQNAGLINPEQKGAIIDMMMKDPENAAKVMQQLARGTIEGFKATAPAVTYTNLGDRVESQVYDPLANTVTGKGGYNTGQSPDNKATNATSLANNQNTVRGSMYNSDNTYEASVYGTDVRSSDTRYNTDTVSNDKGLKLNQDGEIAWANNAVAQTNAQTAQTKASNPKANTPRPVAATKEMSKHLTNIKNNSVTIKTTNSWVKKIQSGELNLGLLANGMNSFSNRTGTNVGSNPAAYAEFKASMIKLASDALRLNSGVQTDMDYKRALEEMQAGTYIPRNNETAIALLSKVARDFNNKTAAEYASYADYKREYDGVSMPEYGHTVKKKPTSSAKPTAGKALGNKIFGGK